jgi:hypothetical protein
MTVEITKQRKRGPKPKVSNGIRDTAYLPADVHEKLVLIGGDNFSHGIRVALLAYEEQHGTDIVPELLVAVK